MLESRQKVKRIATRYFLEIKVSFCILDYIQVASSAYKLFFRILKVLCDEMKSVRVLLMPCDSLTKLSITYL